MTGVAPERPGCVAIHHPKVPGHWKLVRVVDFNPATMTVWENPPEPGRSQSVAPPEPAKSKRGRGRR